MIYVILFKRLGGGVRRRRRGVNSRRKGGRGVDGFFFIMEDGWIGEVLVG